MTVPKKGRPDIFFGKNKYLNQHIGFQNTIILLAMSGGAFLLGQSVLCVECSVGHLVNVTKFSIFHCH